jgi:hypothetical protein
MKKVVMAGNCSSIGKGVFTQAISLWQFSSSDEIRTRENISRVRNFAILTIRKSSKKSD